MTEEKALTEEEKFEQFKQELTERSLQATEEEPRDKIYGFNEVAMHQTYVDLPINQGDLKGKTLRLSAGDFKELGYVSLQRGGTETILLAEELELTGDLIIRPKDLDEPLSV